MHKVPLWGAISFLIILIIVACIGDTDTYTVNQEKYG